jgi:transposase-like protein
LKYGYEPKKDIEMAAKRHKAEEIVTKLRQVDVLNGQGKSMAEAIRSIGVTEVTYYRWRAEYGGLKGDQVKRLKELETENARLRRAVSDLTLDKVILAEAAGGNFLAPLAAALVWIMSPQSWVCPNDGHVGFVASIVPRSAKSQRPRVMKRH